MPRAPSPLSRRTFLAGSAAAASAWWWGPRPASAATGTHDVCVIGSGFAGTHLALELVQRGFRTVLVEAGRSLSAHEGSDGDVARLPYRNLGQIDYPVDACRSISLGGTSRKWAGVASRLLEADFRERSAFGMNVDWPIGYSDLERYYCRAEALLEVHGDPNPALAPAPRSCGLPYERGDYRRPDALFPGTDLRFGPIPASRRPGTQDPVRLIDVEIPRFLASPGASLRSGRVVTRLETRADGAITHARTVDAGGRVERIGARYFVIAAGVVESARLLLRSTDARSPAGLGNHSGHVGGHFHAHPTLRRSLTPPAIAGHGRGSHRSYTPNDRFREAGLSPAQIDLHLLEGSTVIDVQPELQPHGSNRLRLAPDGTPADPSSPTLPPIELDFRFHPRDRRTIERGLALTHDMAVKIGRDPGSVPAPATVWFHPAGTCRMAGQPSDGVVDADTRVFGRPNLFVSGGAVFPTSGTANPTLTVVALALRLADHLGTELTRRAR